MTPLRANDGALYDPRCPPPRYDAPPYSHSITGAFFAFAGACTFRYRQSSDVSPLTPPPFGVLPSGFVGCGQGSLNFVASRAPSHLAIFWGGCHRKSPIGGFAKG